MKPIEGVRWKYARLRRKILRAWRQKRLKNHDFSVFASNCLGGVMLHELGQRFDSPTVNLYIQPPDHFVRFLERPKHYLACELQEIPSDKPWPVGKLDDVIINFMHYPDFASAKAKWEERSKRIHWDNLYVIMVERPFCSDEVLKRFDELPYKHKVCFTAKPHPDLKSAFHIPGSVMEEGVMNLATFRDGRELYRMVDDFDYVRFFNDRS